jgi:hypothetical protein
MAGSRMIELAGPARVKRLAEGVNVRIVRKHKTREIVEVQLLDYGDDSQRKELWANPRKLSIDTDNDQNPSGVWMLKPLFLVDSGTASG